MGFTAGQYPPASTPTGKRRRLSDRREINLTITPLTPTKTRTTPLRRRRTLGLQLTAPLAARIVTTGPKVDRHQLHPCLKVLHKGAAWTHAYCPAELSSRIRTQGQHD